MLRQSMEENEELNRTAGMDIGRPYLTDHYVPRCQKFLRMGRATHLHNIVSSSNIRKLPSRKSGPISLKLFVVLLRRLGVGTTALKLHIQHIWGGI